MPTTDFTRRSVALFVGAGQAIPTAIDICNPEEQQLNESELAKIIGAQLPDSNLRIERDRCFGDPRLGIHTEEMLVMRVYISTPPGKYKTLFRVAESLFSDDREKDLCVRSLNVNGELELLVHFPLPYASAERWPEEKRNLFLDEMARFKISKTIRRYFDKQIPTALSLVMRDPRHPAEIKWESRKNSAIALLKHLLPKRNKVTKRRFWEYF